MEKICAGMVTFNPDKEILISNIASIIDKVDAVIVHDNGSTNIKMIDELCKQNEVILLKNSKNQGIARALNQLCQYAIDNDFSWIITLDQDSITEDNLIKELTRYVSNDVAILAPNVIYRHNEKFADEIKKGIREEQWVITSASLTNLNVWRKIGGFDENLFIDGVDRDFCIRANQAGYKVLKDYNVSIWHDLGNLKCRKMFGRTIYVTNHSPKRKYYMVRNAIYLDKKLELNTSKLYIIKILIKTLLYEDDRIKKIKDIKKGISDGKKMVH